MKYLNETSETVEQIEEKLFKFGQDIGWRLVEIIALKTNNPIRYIKINTVLQFISTKLWPELYYKSTDQLQKSTDDPRVYYVYENEPVINKYITLPRELKNSLNCANFNAGIIFSVLACFGFKAEVKTLSVQDSHTTSVKTVYQITFADTPGS